MIPSGAANRRRFGSAGVAAAVVLAFALGCAALAGAAEPGRERGADDGPPDAFVGTATAHWKGYVDGAVLFHLDLWRDRAGQWAGAARVPGLADPEMAVSEVEVTAGLFTLENARILARLSSEAWGDCDLRADVAGNTMLGLLRVHGNSTYVDLRAVPPALEPRPRAPWKPAEPVPYRAHEVSYRRGEVVFAGELTVPDGAGPHPAVVLLSGGGADDRDGNDFPGQGASYYHAMADHLTRRGFAVLRTDDRGTGGTGGDYETTTLDELADDAAAAAEFLATRPEVRKDRVGIVGFSEGASLAPMAATRTGAVSFVALLAPEAVPGATGEVERLVRRARNGTSPRSLQGIEEQIELRRAIFGPLLAGVDAAEIRMRLLEAGRFEVGDAEWAVRALANRRDASRFRHDPGATLARVTVPMLAVYFGKDDVVPPDLNEPAFRAAAGRGGNADVTVKLFEKLGHVMREPEPEPGAEPEAEVEPEAKAGGDVIAAPAADGEAEKDLLADVDKPELVPTPVLLPNAEVLDFVAGWLAERAGLDGDDGAAAGGEGAGDARDAPPEPAAAPGGR